MNLHEKAYAEWFGVSADNPPLKLQKQIALDCANNKLFSCLGFVNSWLEPIVAIQREQPGRIVVFYEGNPSDSLVEIAYHSTDGVLHFDPQEVIAARAVLRQKHPELVLPLPEINHEARATAKSELLISARNGHAGAHNRIGSVAPALVGR